MGAYEAFWIWWDFSSIAGAAVPRAKNVDVDDVRIDWDRQQQSMRIAGLSFACSLLEAIGQKRTDIHSKLLFNLRNAVLHNGGDITKNTGHPKPYNETKHYLDNKCWEAIDGDNRFNLSRAFAMDVGGAVSLEPAIFALIQRVLWGYLTQKEKSLGAPS